MKFRTVNSGGSLGRLTFRPMELEDAWYVICWRNASRDAFFDSRVVTPDSHRAFLEARKPHDLIWIAEEDCRRDYRPYTRYRRPVGMVSLTVDVDAAAAEFGRFCVDPKVRDRGYGRYIMSVALAVAFDILQLEAIWLQCWPFLADYYQALGWEHTLTMDLEPSRSRMLYAREVWLSSALRASIGGLECATDTHTQ